MIRKCARMWSILLVAVLIPSLHLCVEAQQLSDPLPVDSNVVIKKLENGITYYIRRNIKPEHRAEVRLAVNVGSILEEDHERGLAHVVEHMAFNGTKNFPKHVVIDYLESIGMRFGPDINAYTGFDETVYMLQVPTDTAGPLERSCEILSEWAQNIAFEDDEIEKERGVVIEEWRLGRGANARITDKQFPVILKGSRYAERLAIGTKEVLERFSPDDVRSFYEKWYRPDLMGVIAVGDFDVHQMERLIKTHFAAIPNSSPRSPLPSFEVPNHTNPLYSIVTDPEATFNAAAIFFKRDHRSEITHRDYREQIMESLFSSMFNQRYRELARKDNPPFLFASAQTVQFVRTKSLNYLVTSTKENSIPRGFEALLTEAERARQHGFTVTELDREKKSLMRAIERMHDERDKTESGQLADEYGRHFLEKEPIPGIEYEFRLYKSFIPEISLDEINAVAREWLDQRNMVVTSSGPEKPGVTMPTESELDGLIRMVNQTIVSPYADESVSEMLLEVPPDPGAITQRSRIDTLDVTEWQLSNGVRVILKPTNFKNDQILFSAFSPGGSSLVSDKEHIAAISATSLLLESGVAQFDRIALEKMMSGKVASVSPFIGELEEGFSGSASPKDMETLFQLIYLYATSPRADTSAFRNYKTRMEASLENRSARPESPFLDTIDVTMAQHHVRRRPWSSQILDELNLAASLRIYRERFSDFSDFTFVFVGAFTLEDIEAPVKTYLAALPSLKREEQWRDIGVRPPRGVVRKVVRQGIEPKSQVRIIFTGPFEYTYENRVALQSLVSVMRIKLRESLREEKGGTYGVSIAGYPASRPEPSYNITVTFGSDPDRMEELIETAFAVIDSVKFFGPGESHLDRAREIQRRERETDKKENRFWLRGLEGYYKEQEDPVTLLRFETELDSLTSIRIMHAAQKYFDSNNYVQVVLYPANQ